MLPPKGYRQIISSSMYDFWKIDDKTLCSLQLECHSLSQSISACKSEYIFYLQICLIYSVCKRAENILSAEVPNIFCLKKCYCILSADVSTVFCLQTCLLYSFCRRAYCILSEDVPNILFLYKCLIYSVVSSPPYFPNAAYKFLHSYLSF